ncbi:hypothetical protein GCM10009616_37800 [Microlunatus lacustris]
MSTLFLGFPQPSGPQAELPDGSPLGAREADDYSGLQTLFAALRFSMNYSTLSLVSLMMVRCGLSPNAILATASREDPLAPA